MKKNEKMPVITNSNHLLELIRYRKELIGLDASKIYRWWFPCHVKVLMVTDGALDFGLGDFGLSAFLDCMLNDARSYVKFDITLAHLRSNVNNDEMGSATSGIVNRITDFRFDNPNHFSANMYDQVWLFGIETFYHNSSYASRSASPAVYPANSLSQNELSVIAAFMDSGRGVFATGDHGALGKGLCGNVQRVKSMRFWDSTSPVDTVSMTGANRNDTNQVGDTGTQFSDQSDDIPQTIQPKLYHHRIGRYTDELYPHPLLCCNTGRITVLPDHPHEGECREPVSNAELAEYPVVNSVQVLPEVIATSHVVAGNTGSLNVPGQAPFSKSPTVAQSFGAISAYDGHSAGVGRVVTDATWHHFINVNLIGIVEGDRFDDLTASNSFTKHDGFMSTATGQAHMAKIKEYYVNIGVWISTPSLIGCFNTKLLYRLLYSDRIMEAALVDPNVSLEKISPNLFYSIGTHARDVLTRIASPCSSWKFIIWYVERYLPDLIPHVDPWKRWPRPEPELETPLPWFDLSPVLSIMLGNILVMVRQEFPYPPEKIDEKFVDIVDEIAGKAAQRGLEMGFKYYKGELKNYESLLEKSLRSLIKKDNKDQNNLKDI